MINRIRNYDYINRELQTPPPEAPPIIQHKDDISQLTIYNTGWSEGYYDAYQDGRAFSTINRVTVGVFLLVAVIAGIAIGIWLP
jgi:hypothetical protein